MKKTKIVLLVLIIVIVILCVIEAGLVYKVVEYSNSVIYRDLEEFNPSSNSGTLIDYETDFKLDGELPRIVAASAFYPFTSNLVKNVYPKTSDLSNYYKKESTINSFKSLINNEADAIIVSEYNEVVEEFINNSNSKFKITKLYKTPLCIYVNVINPIDNIKLEDLKKMYLEKDLTWNIFGVDNLDTIHTYQIPADNGSQMCITKKIGNITLGNNHYESKNMNRIIDDVAFDKNGIGYAFYEFYSKMYSNKMTKIIDVEKKSVTDADYPLLFDVCFIYLEDNKNSNVLKLENWLLSEEGQDFINKVK